MMYLDDGCDLDDSVLLELAKREVRLQKSSAVCGASGAKRFYWNKKARQRLRRLNKALAVQIFGNEDE